MTDTHVLSALKTKRAELCGDLIAAEKLMLRLRADLESLERTIRVFDPAAEPQRIRPLLKRKPPVLFPRGELSRAVLGILRDAGGPMTPREIAQRLAADFRLDIDAAELARFINKVRNTLVRQKGSLVSEPRGMRSRGGWRSAGRQNYLSKNSKHKIARQLDSLIANFVQIPTWTLRAAERTVP